jgi:hypothetical protein
MLSFDGVDNGQQDICNVGTATVRLLLILRPSRLLPAALVSCLPAYLPT